MNNSTNTINIFFKNYVKKAKQTSYQSLLTDCQNGMKRRSQIMKEITREMKLNSNRFSKSINVNGNAIKMNSHITEEFIKQLTNVRPNLASKVQNTSKNLEIFYSPQKIIWNTRSSLLKNLKKILSQ